VAPRGDLRSARLRVPAYGTRITHHPFFAGPKLVPRAREGLAQLAPSLVGTRGHVSPRLDRRGAQLGKLAGRAAALRARLRLPYFRLRGPAVELRLHPPEVLTPVHEASSARIGCGVFLLIFIVPQRT
jgi:hypothetical protein